MSESKGEYTRTYLVAFEIGDGGTLASKGVISMTLHWTKEQNAWTSHQKYEFLRKTVAKEQRVDIEDIAIMNIVNLDAVM